MLDLMPMQIQLFCLTLQSQKLQMDTNNEIILYQPDASVKLEVRLGDDTVWLTQQQMSDLFLRD